MNTDDFSLTPDEERELTDALIRRAAADGTLGGADVHAVTRKFLEEVLAGAMIPDELLDSVVAAYRAHGRLAMSEDGGRYTITLRS